MSKTSIAAPTINRTVLMSGAEHFSVKELNPYSNSADQPEVARTIAEHQAIQAALESAGVTVTKVGSPADCQDGVYTANWALIRGDTAVMSSLPAPRQGEEPHAEAALRNLGKRIIKPPYRFSGQGDALPVGNYLLAGSGYRTDPRVHPFLADELGYEVISLRTIPARNPAGVPVTNQLTGWPDSFFYDIDLAISILRSDLIAWCPDAFEPESQAKIRALSGLDKIEVSYEEAVKGFACNLVSTGHTVVMSAHGPKLKAAIEARGLATLTPAIRELIKGGGYIRCTTLTLDNA
ncbi:MAG TPA: arginine deiminase-related protein [Candidatus Saccharimonadia bacterium]|jgi:N-dimethylarginine dimethylaminohydrolase